MRESTFESRVSRHQHFWILITQRDFKKTFFLEKKYNKPFAYSAVRTDTTLYMYNLCEVLKVIR